MPVVSLNAAVERRLDGVPGTVSVWIGPPGGPPVCTRRAAEPHYAASLMKLAVLHALDPSTVDEEVAVHNDFASVQGGRFGLERRHDADPEVWQRLGERVRLGWLARRMITHSSNLATNLVLERVGIRAADAVWRDLPNAGSRLTRPIGDTVAAEAGQTNLVTAADVAALLARLDLTILYDQARARELPDGLPAGTRVAHKNGWVTGVRHAAGVIFPEDAPTFVVVVCTTTPLAINRPDDEACRIVSDITREAWRRRG
jgi:beta-lactamase class A